MLVLGLAFKVRSRDRACHRGAAIPDTCSALPLPRDGDDVPSSDEVKPVIGQSLTANPVGESGPTQGACRPEDKDPDGTTGLKPE